MSEPRILKRAKVTLLWRPYGDAIEWRFDLDPEPFPHANEVHDWERCARSAEIPPLMMAMFKLGEHVSSLDLWPDPLSIVEDPNRRKPPRCGSYDETAGEVHEDGLSIRFGGACPVQGEGTLDGCYCYYRARGRRWSFSVWPQGVDIEDDGLPDCKEEWYYGQDNFCAFPDAGWLHRDESIANLREALAAWRARK